MKHFARMRHSVAVITLTGFTVAAVIGVVNVIQPDPTYTGGLRHSAAVTRTEWDITAANTWDVQ